MFVKYTGHSPMVIVEYNGIRYGFSNKGETVDMPPAALIYAYRSGHIHAQDLIPVERDDIAQIIEENKALKEKVKNFESANKEANTHRRGRPRKDK